MTLKQMIYEHCLQVLEDKIAAVRGQQDALQQALGNETKSTAGDKYETGRAMIHLEQEQISRQLQEAQQQKNIFLQTGLHPAAAQVQPGSLVRTDKGWFFISAGLGRQQVTGQTVYVISPAAPLGRQLLLAVPGQEVSVNNMTYRIEEIC